MKIISMQQVVSQVEDELGRSLDDDELGYVTNVIEGYNGDLRDYTEIKASIREGILGLLMIGEYSLLEVIDAIQLVCDKLLRKGIVESN